MPDTGDADKGGGAGLILVKKRRRLMPTQPFDKVTPEAGTIYALHLKF